MKLNTIVDKAALKKAKRVGRGIGSGTGKTSGAGHKGQKSRSGVAIKGFEGGQMPLHRRLPKRGFKNPFRLEYSIINLGVIDKAISDKKLDPKKQISKEDLHKAGLIRKKNSLIKILGKGEINHSFDIMVDKASKNAIKLINKNKGNIKFYENKKDIIKKETDKNNKTKTEETKKN
jgi:large subunit ribosomal protein L15